MLTKKSRYKNTKGFSAIVAGELLFAGLRARDIDKATGVIEHEIQEGDRLDLLARHYYNDDRLWWRIVDANPNVLFAQGLFDKNLVGNIILIPKIKE